MSESIIRPHHPFARELSELCAAFGLEPSGDVDQIEVTGVSSHSDRVVAGDVFAALPGRQRHGAEFAEVAIDNGAVAILTDGRGAALVRDASVPLIVVDEVRLALGHLAGWVHRTDPEAARLLGVTGARGKTSVVETIAALLRILGDEAATSGTLGRRVGEETAPAVLTTPEADELHAMIARMRETGVRFGAVEVTAHSVHERRIAGLEFEVIGFVSFAPEMLAPGVDAEATITTMIELFTPEHARRGVVSIDGEWGRRVVEETRIPVTTVATRPDRAADWHVTAEHLDEQLLVTVVGHEGRQVRATVWCDDEFAVANLGLAIVMLEEAGLDLEQVQEALDRAGGIDLTAAEHLPAVTVSEDVAREAGW
ncbi:Mur ligase family protein [Gulosibacter macacae]|nr:Mur ligase family protein [Gulosibacter macacae]